MADNRVTFNKLVLEGFGPYYEWTEFILSPGINCYVAGNETGKSTLVAGLVATFFGLTHRQSASFSLERFRNWDNPARCVGEVYFTVEDRDYLVTRDFDSHFVALWLMEGDDVRKKLIVEGTHNPEARKTLQKYDDNLQELLGIGSRELFSDTFCVEQPLPEPGNISAELQGLLAGGKGTSFHNALDNLTDGLKALTKYTGPNDRGVTKRNLNTKGQLEQIADDIADLEEKISRGRQTADSLVDIQEQLGKAEEELKKVRTELAGKGKTRQAWFEWKNMADNYRSASRERDKLNSAREQALELDKKLKQLKSELDREYPEFSGAPSETGDNLGELINIEKKLGERDTMINKLQKELEEDGAALDKHEEEHKRHAARELLGADPVDKIGYIRRSAESCRQDWNQLTRLTTERDEAEEELKNKYAPFEKASEEELELAANYNRQHAQLSSNVDKARQELSAVEEKEKKYRETEVGINDKYADLYKLSEVAVEAVENKLKELKRKRELEGETAQNTPEKVAAAPLSSRLAGAAVLAVLAVIAVIVIGLDSIPFIIAAAVVGALTGYWAGGMVNKRSDDTGDRKQIVNRLELQKCLENIAACDSKLGEFAALGEADLGALSQRLQHYEEEKSRLKNMAEEISPAIKKELQEKLHKAKAELSDFEKKTAHFSANFDDVQAALGKWRQLAERRQSLQKQLEEVAEKKLGCSAAAFASADPMSEGTAEHWKEAARFLKLVSGDAVVQDTASMAEYLESLPGSWWEEQEEKAAQLASLNKEIEVLKNRKSTQEERLNEEKEAREKLQAEKNGYTEIMPGILEKNDHDAAAALERWKKMQQQSKEKEEAEIQLKTVLDNNNAKDIAGLESRAATQQDNVGAIMHRWQEHIAKYPGLPGTDQADDMEKVSSYLDNLDREIEQLEAKRDNLEERRNELSRQQSSLEGESPLNIAAAELELEELKQRKEWLEIKADALEMAYKELGEAINEYRHTYKERLEEQASSYCRKISGVSGRNVTMDDDFSIAVIEGGRDCTVEQLSKGARDQLYLSLRFALADLLADETKLPMIFDDPFTSTDTNRLDNIRDILQKQEEERQFIILSHADTFRSWGKQLEKG